MELCETAAFNIELLGCHMNDIDSRLSCYTSSHVLVVGHTAALQSCYILVVEELVLPGQHGGTATTVSFLEVD